MNRNGYFFGFCTVLAVFGFVGGAAAQEHVESSRAFVAEVTEQAAIALTEQGLSDAQLEERLRGVLVENLAIRNISRFVLGRFWNNNSNEDKLAFFELFEDVTVKSWAGRLGLLGGQRITVLGAVDIGTRDPNIKGALVRSTFGSGSDQLSVDWQVMTARNVSKVTDVVVSGISLVQAQKDEFEAVLRQNGGDLDALNEILRARRAGGG